MSITHHRSQAGVSRAVGEPGSNLIASMLIIVVIMGLLLWGSCEVFGAKSTFTVFALLDVIGAFVLYFCIKNAQMDPSEMHEQPCPT